MKKLLGLLLAMVMCISFCVPAFASEDNPEEPNTSYTINEYTSFINGEAIKTGTSRSNAYVEKLRELTAYSSEQLTQMGYSAGNIAIIDKLRSDKNYIPSDDELTRAAATVTLNVSAQVDKRTSLTYVYVTWNFEWSSWPLSYATDGVAISWSGDYTINENTIVARVDYGTSYLHYYRNMNVSIDIAHSGFCGERQMTEYLTSIDGTRFEAFAYRGNGSFTLACYDHAHNACQIQWAYGHSVLNLTASVGVGFGTTGPSVAANIGFKTGVQKLSPGIQTFFA